MFIPGKIENWVVIADMSGLSLNKLPVKETKEISSVIQNNFRGTLARAWCVNCSGFQLFCWKLAEVFMEK